MAELMNIQVSTNDLQKRIDSGEQFEILGYSNRIKLRSTSRANILANIMNYAVVDSGYSLKEFEDKTAESIGPSKPINLKEDRFDGMVANISNTLNFDVTDSSEMAIENEDKASLEAEEPQFEDNNPKEEEAKSEEVEVTEEKKEVSPEVSLEDSNLGDKSLNSTDVDKAYEEILKETNEAKQAKEAADKASEEAKKQEALTQKQIEESDKKVLEKSTEQSEIQAKKEAATARKMEVDKQILSTLNKQKSIMKQAKNDYLAQQKTSNERIAELKQQAETRTQENENRIVEFQKNIDADRIEINAMEEEIAKKEAILAALSNSPEFFTNMQNSDANSTTMENSESHAKVA